MAEIEVRGLTKTFGRVAAVRDVSFTAPQGKVTGLLGPNGSGKTTTLRVLLGLVQASAGEALIGGVRYDRLARPRQMVGAMLESTGFHPGRRARDHLRVLADADGIAARRVDEVLERTGLTAAARRPVRQFSLGMRQRLGLAAALLRGPRLLVLDEPANGLDPRGIREIRDLLVRLNEAGTTVFLSSHQLAEVEQLCTRVGVINRGRLVLQAELAALQPVTGRVIVHSPDTDRAAAELDGQIASRDGDQLVVTGTDPAQLNTRLVTAGLRVTEIRPERRSLEELVLELTGPGADRVDRDAGRPGGGRNAEEAGQQGTEKGLGPP